MTPMAPHVTSFLRERLPVERGASAHTCEAYSYGLKLFFEYASSKLGKRPSDLNLEDLDAPLVLEFLEHIELKRGNSPSTRNARLTAIKSFMHFVEYRVPSVLAQCKRVFAIPLKKCDQELVHYLSMTELKAVLDSPNLETRSGIRDRSMLHLCFAAGLRVSELVSLTAASVSLSHTPSLWVLGKGRRQRNLPLMKQATSDLRAWLAIRGDATVPELYLNSRNNQMTRSGFEYILRKHVKAAIPMCPSLEAKKISPHVLRHTCAMMILQSTGDIRRVSLWLGHAQLQTTQIYVDADPLQKLETVDGLSPLPLKRGRFRVADKLISSMKGP